MIVHDFTQKHLSLWGHLTFEKVRASPRRRLRIEGRKRQVLAFIFVYVGDIRIWVGPRNPPVRLASNYDPHSSSILARLARPPCEAPPGAILLVLFQPKLATFLRPARVSFHMEIDLMQFIFLLSNVWNSGLWQSYPSNGELVEFKLQEFLGRSYEATSGRMRLLAT